MEDVVIVGGGPTGFITALGLAQAGVRVTVIEAEPQIVDSPRAAVYHWSVVEGLEKLGIRAEVEQIGFPKQDYTYLVHKTGERIDFSLDVLNGRTPYPYNLHLGQHRLAEIALRRLADFPHASVRFSTRLTSAAAGRRGRHAAAHDARRAARNFAPAGSSVLTARAARSATSSVWSSRA